MSKGGNDKAQRNDHRHGTTSAAQKRLTLKEDAALVLIHDRV